MLPEQINQLSGSGTSELMKALHLVYDQPEDKIVREDGRSTSSVPTGLGMVYARDLLGKNYHVVSVTEGGSLTGEMAYEALKHVSRMKTNYVIILNDHDMPVPENTGFLSGMFSGNPGIKYLGPADGHDLSRLISMIREAKESDGPVIVHVISSLTQEEKKEYAEPAEKKKREVAFQDAFDDMMCRIAAEKKELAAITAGMPERTGLKRFRCMYPDRFFDADITGKDAAGFAAGLAMAGCVPVVCADSYFLQHAFYQIVQEICLQNLHVVFAVDNSGSAETGGAAYPGIFDFSSLSRIPGMTVMAPVNSGELADMLSFAVNDYNGPAALCFPRGEAPDELNGLRAPVRLGKSGILYDEKGIALFAAGSMAGTARRVRTRLRRMGYSCSLINVRFIRPLDEELLLKAAKEHELVVTLEDNVRTGGYGDHVLEFYNDTGSDVRVINIAVPDEYAEYGNPQVPGKPEAVGEDAILQKIIAEYVGINKE